jgi:hypothetical protein
MITFLSTIISILAFRFRRRASLELELIGLRHASRNTMAMVGQPDATFVLYPQPTPVQARAFKLLEITANL